MTNTLRSGYRFMIVLALAVCCFGSTTTLAQSVAAQVSGTVRDAAGAIIPGANIRLIDTATNTEQTTTSNTEGFYVFANVRAGTYVVAAEGQGFTVGGTQTVRYGIGTQWITISVTGAGTCSNGFFGSDPAHGIVKQCEVAAGGTGANAAARR